MVAGIAVDRGHDPALDPDGVVQDLGQRGQAVGGAGGVGKDGIPCGDQVMVHHPCSALRFDVLASLELSSELALADNLE